MHERHKYRRDRRRKAKDPIATVVARSHCSNGGSRKVLRRSCGICIKEKVLQTKLASFNIQCPERENKQVDPLDGRRDRLKIGRAHV